MIVAVFACLVGLIAVIATLLRDSAVEEPGPSAPGWEGLPGTSDVARADFPMAMPGYDPATVELHLDEVARAYADIVDAAPPEALERARERHRMRTGAPRPAGSGWSGLSQEPPGSSADRSVAEQIPEAASGGGASGEAASREALSGEAPSRPASSASEEDSGEHGQVQALRAEAMLSALDDRRRDGGG
jgi:DivIVA domain-containing protein